MNRLTEIGKKYNTDKATYHNFTSFYDEYFSKFKEPTILEIGVDKGVSIETYDEYFNKKCRIVAVDNQNKEFYFTNRKNIKCVVADQANREELGKVKDIYSEYDIIVDDGGHMVHQQIISLSFLFPMLKKNGIYIMEDLHTSFYSNFTAYEGRQSKITTFQYLFDIQNKHFSESEYLSKEENKYLFDNIVNIRFFNNVKNTFENSVTCIFEKR